MTDLTVRLFGQFQVTSAGEAIITFSTDKVRALLAYLVCNADRPHRREVLADLLWPDKTEEASRNNLRRALSDLRRAINNGQSEPPYLLITRQSVQWNSQSRAQVDALEFSRIPKLIIEDPENIENLEQLAGLYQGEFLDGFSLPDSIPFHEWLLYQREQFSRKELTLLAAIANYYEQNRAYEVGLPFAWRLVELNPWDESGQRQLLRLLAFTGQRGAALTQYEKLVADLDDSLGVFPENATTELYELIKANQLESGLVQVVPQTLERPSFLDNVSEAMAQQEEYFVGRHDELARLDSYLDRMLRDQGQVVFVAGEAGSGKTVLMREFSHLAQKQEEELVVSCGNCNAFSGMGDPYLPFREILGSLTGDVEAAWRAGVISHEQALKLWRILPYTAKLISESAPDLLETFIAGDTVLKRLKRAKLDGQDWGELEATVAHKKEIAGANVPMQANLFSQYVRVLQLLSQQAPLMLILDDLQWADAGTLGLLFHLGKQLAGHRILLLGAYRPEDVVAQPEGQHSLLSVLNEFQRDYGDITVDLNQSQKEAFIDALLDSEPNQFDNAFRATLFHLTRGHALFTVELLDGLKARRDVHRDEQGEWIAKPELNWDVLPPRVEGIIAERIRRIPEHLRQILTVASVEGEFFTAEVVADAIGTPAPDILTRLSGQLDRQHGLVRARQVEWVDGQQRSSYRFRHFLFQKYVYSQMDPIEQAGWHAKVGQALETMSGDRLEEKAAQLARHFHQAGQKHKAIEYYRMAGERARIWSANAEAIEHYNIALALINELPESQERDTGEIGLQLGLGIAWQSLQGFGAEMVGKAYNRAWELCQRVGDAPFIFDALGLLSSYYNFQLALERSYEIVIKVHEMAVTQNNPMRVMQSYWGFGYVAYLYGEYGQALTYIDKALEILDPNEHVAIRRTMGLDPGTYCHGWAFFFSSFLGQFERAAAEQQNALNYAEQSPNRLDKALVIWQSMLVCDIVKDGEELKSYAEELTSLAQAEGFFLYVAVANVGMGVYRAVYAGDPKGGIECIQQGLELMGTIGFKEYQFHIHMARACYAAGLIDEGLTAIEKAEVMMDESGGGILKSESFVAKGLLYLGQNKPGEAESCFLQAIDVAREQSAKLFELRATLELARFWQSQGKEVQARDALQNIYGWFTDGLDKPILQEAKTLLDELD